MFALEASCSASSLSNFFNCTAPFLKLVAWQEPYKSHACQLFPRCHPDVMWQRPKCWHFFIQGTLAIHFSACVYIYIYFFWCVFACSVACENMYCHSIPPPASLFKSHLQFASLHAYINKYIYMHNIYIYIYIYTIYIYIYLLFIHLLFFCFFVYLFIFYSFKYLINYLYIYLFIYVYLFLFLHVALPVKTGMSFCWIAAILRQNPCQRQLTRAWSHWTAFWPQWSGRASRTWATGILTETAWSPPRRLSCTLKGNIPMTWHM